MAIEALFPTPIGIYDTQDRINLEPITKYLKTYSTDRHGLIWNGESSHGNDWPNPTFLLNDPELSKLKNLIVEYLDKYCDEVGNERVKLANSWFNKMDHEGRVNRHRHETSTLSGAYYVKAKAGTCPLSLLNPTHIYKMTEVSSSATKYTAPEASIDAFTGRLIIFPSWLEHHTMPNLGDERIVISFNSVDESMIKLCGELK